MLSKKNLDELNPTSRAFYERSLLKMNLSLVFAAFAFMFLGFSAASGTKSVDQKYAPRKKFWSFQECCNFFSSEYQWWWCSPSRGAGIWVRGILPHSWVHSFFRCFHLPFSAYHWHQKRVKNTFYSSKYWWDRLAVCPAPHGERCSWSLRRLPRTSFCIEQNLDVKSTSCLMIKKNFLIFLCIGSFIISERKKLRNNENLQILRVRGSQREAWEGFHRSKSTGRRKVVASFEEL